MTNQFMWGALSMASCIAALFFIRFWRRSQDRLFLIFALAFAALAVNWAGLGLTYPSRESSHYMYIVRLLAFVLFVVGIVDKNRRD
jgi:hypothetical protein